MGPAVANPVMGFRARFNRLLIFVQRLEKDRRVSVEPLYKHFSQPPDNKVLAIISEHPVDPVDKVRNCKKSIKTRRLRPRWRIRGKRTSKRLSESLPRRCVDIPRTVDSEHLVSMSQSVP